jgi:RND family efflux transporter MFP subunit
MKKYILLILLIIFSLTVAWILRENKKTLNVEGQLSESSVEVLPVNVEEVKRRDISERFVFSGILKPAKELMVISQTQGMVEEIFYELGDYVRKGAVIVKVDSELLGAQFKVTEANYEKAKKDIARFEKMAQVDGVTRDQLEKMQLNLKNAEAQHITTKKRLEDTSVKAPFNGYINQVFTKKGSMLGPGVPVFEVVDISGFKMTIKCSEDEISDIHTDMAVRVKPKSLENVELSGKVSKVSVSADMAQQYTIEVLVDQSPEQQLKGGMIANVEILGETHSRILAVNRNFMVEEEGKKYVYTLIDDKAIQTEVTPGAAINGLIEIINGIDEGDQIITSGINLLSDGKKVKIVE